MPILVDATIRKGIIVPKRQLNMEEQDVFIRIETIHKEPALKTRICASEELVEEVLASEPDMFF